VFKQIYAKLLPVLIIVVLASQDQLVMSMWQYDPQSLYIFALLLPLRRD